MTYAERMGRENSYKITSKKAVFVLLVTFFLEDCWICFNTLKKIVIAIEPLQIGRLVTNKNKKLNRYTKFKEKLTFLMFSYLHYL